MKRIVSTVLLLAVLAPSACKHKQDVPAAATSASTPGAVASAVAGATPVTGDFEGEIALLAKGKFAGNDGTPLNLTLLIKDNRIRIDLPASLTAARGFGPAYVLAQPADKKLFVILDAKKQAVLLEFDKLAAQTKAFGAHPRPVAAAPPSVPSSAQRTGKSDTVAGIKCDIWHFNQGKTAGDACIAEQETAWFHLPIGGTPAELSWLPPIADGKHFPLRFVATDQSVESGRIEVTSIQKKPLLASQFELPADYAVLSMEQMIGSMLGGLGGPAMKLPPGTKLPPGVNLPPGMTMPQSK